MGGRKGKLLDTIEKARFVKGSYEVQFRDFDRLLQVPFAEYWKVRDLIPGHRIARVLKDGTVVYESSKPALLALKVVVAPEIDEKKLRSGKK